MARRNVSPNLISCLGVVVAALGCALFVVSGMTGQWARVACLVGGGVCIQLRLACNMLDGLVAIEGGKKTALGPLFNEVPDRLGDVLFLVGFGYSAGSGVIPAVIVGWAAALAAVMTAYVRLLGGSLGQAQDFCGPLAKQHRMALLTAACLLCAILAVVDPHVGRDAVVVILGIEVVGAVATSIRRLGRISTLLRAAT